MSRDAGADVREASLLLERSTRKGNSPSARLTIQRRHHQYRICRSKLEVPLADDWKLKSLASTWIRAVSATTICRATVSQGINSVLVELPVKKVAVYRGFTHAWGEMPTCKNPWSGYPGYTSVQVQDFNRAVRARFFSGWLRLFPGSTG